MGNKSKYYWLRIVGATLILIGALSIFPENNTWIHTLLQITFVLGCIIFVIGGYLAKKINSSTNVWALILTLTLSTHILAQDYTEQINAYEESFNKKDIFKIKF